MRWPIAMCSHTVQYETELHNALKSMWITESCGSKKRKKNHQKCDRCEKINSPFQNVRI